jgi:hypothetical protein
MIRKMLVGGAALAVMVPGLAFAQASTATGAVGGAAVGAVVGGPVGAVVGGAVGATVGAAAEPPAEVRSYVVQERRPSVTVREEVSVGRPLPRQVVVYEVPNSDYEYAVVNGQRVIVEPGTRKVVYIVN